MFAAIGEPLANGEEVRIAEIQGLRHRKQANPNRALPGHRRSSFDVGVGIADIQGQEDAAGCRPCRSRVMTLQRQRTATPRA